MSDKRRLYPLTLAFNKRRFNRLVIDPHYEEKHLDMTDEIIMELVKQLHETETEADGETDGFKYFARELC
jgi:hypothetical protein